MIKIKVTIEEHEVTDSDHSVLKVGAATLIVADADADWDDLSYDTRLSVLGLTANAAALSAVNKFLNKVIDTCVILLFQPGAPTP